MSDSLLGKVVLVTGASRGLGRGIAEVMVLANATVYITGRAAVEGSQYKSVLKTAEELNLLNKGKCHGIICDHSNDNNIIDLFKIIRDAHGRLDILVNNVFSGTDDRVLGLSKEFWNDDAAKKWDKFINIGTRSNYIASCEAAKIMVPQKSGLIVNISSLGGLAPLFNELYGLGKEANDRMVTEMGAILVKHNVAMVSLYPGLVRTEIMEEYRNQPSEGKENFAKKHWDTSEHPTLTGKAVLFLANDPNLISKSSKIHIVADLAQTYGFTDVNDITPISLRSIRFYVAIVSPFMSKFIPHCLKVPGWLLTAYYNKF